MDKEKVKLPKIWHPQHEKILKDWGEAAACYRYMNHRAYLLYKKLSMRFTLPVIVLSTVTGTANFAQGQFPESIRSSVPSIIGGLNLIAGLVATIMQFLKINELMESHRVASLSYGKLSRTIRLELSLPLKERTKDGKEIVEECRAEYDRLLEQSPSIPSTVLIAFEQDFPSDEYLTKPEIMHIKPIDPFKAITENTVISQLKGFLPSGDRTKEDLRRELNVIQGKTETPTKFVEQAEVTRRELEDLKQRSVIKELKARAELQKVVVEDPKDDTQHTE
jgi:hypothetical protein